MGEEAICELSPNLVTADRPHIAHFYSSWLAGFADTYIQTTGGGTYIHHTYIGRQNEEFRAETFSTVPRIIFCLLFPSRDQERKLITTLLQRPLWKEICQGKRNRESATHPHTHTHTHTLNVRYKVSARVCMRYALAVTLRLTPVSAICPLVGGHCSSEGSQKKEKKEKSRS